ncbi:MAG: ATP-binding protein [Candidatus Omnitrophota bacterium]|nr:ATP-binding protein [Candidatus Omnitrophota bacterium]
MEIKRSQKIAELKAAFRYSPAVAILGPRQCGKTTLSHQFVSDIKGESVHFFDLEDPNDLAALDNPKLTLEKLKGIIVIDEIQRCPDLFPVLRVLIDKCKEQKYLILGSASKELLRQSSETLAGRISYHELSGFSLDEISILEQNKIWIRGGFPRSFLAHDYKASYDWRQNFIMTFLERDIPNLGFHISAKGLRRFWMMLAHYHGNIFNASEISKSLAISNVTAGRYLDILSGAFLIRQLQPWFYNTKKRLIKRPKIYFRDSGIFHALLGITTIDELNRHPRLGSSWEGFVIEQIINHLGLKEEEVYFWGVHTGAECDFIFLKKGKLWGVEVKYQDAPHLTPSMRSAIDELSLEHLWIVYPGNRMYTLADKITVLPISNCSTICPE